jgi:REP element-mobilizing transposase RayT
MPRKMRVEYPGAIYHIMSRGDRREDIYLDDVDRQDFLKTLAETCQKTRFQVHAYCLMRNHFHLAGVGNNDAAEVDCGASSFGHVQERHQQALPLDEGERQTRRRRSPGL